MSEPTKGRWKWRDISGHQPPLKWLTPVSDTEKCIIPCYNMYFPDKADSDLIERAWEIPKLEAHIKKLEDALKIARGFVARSNEPHAVTLGLIDNAFQRGIIT